MTDAVQAGRGLVDYPGLYPNATGTVVANISGVTAIPGPITLAALAAAMGSTSYQGTWNASTNTPTLASSVGTNGYYYVVSVAGTTTLNGIADWTVGDWAIYNGNVSAWQKVEGGATTMTVGTTTVTGGTSPYLLYNNAGVLGNTTTPAVTSLALGGATIGSNALAVTGTSAFGGNINPTVGGSIDLGTAATRFGAIFAQSVGLGGYAPASGGFAGTTLALGGATIGSNALAVTGTAAISGATVISATGTALQLSTTTPTLQIGSTNNLQIIYDGTTNDAATFRLSRDGASSDFIFRNSANIMARAQRVGSSGAAQFRLSEAVATPAGGTAGLGYTFGSTTNFGVFFGSGAPTLSAAKGSLYLRSDGTGVADRMYVNTDASTTWTAVATVA